MRRMFDAVVHLDALAGGRLSMTYPIGYHSTNVNGTLRLPEYCRSMQVPHFVFASSSSVYGPDATWGSARTAPPTLAVPTR